MGYCTTETVNTSDFSVFDKDSGISSGFPSSINQKTGSDGDGSVLGDRTRTCDQREQKAENEEWRVFHELHRVVFQHVTIVGVVAWLIASLVIQPV
jgi:hypothetical protein